MNAKVTYRVDWGPNEWTGKDDCWRLSRVTTPVYGDPECRPVAFFNLDSDAIAFQAYLLLSGVCEEGKEAIIDVDGAVRLNVGLTLKAKNSKVSC